MSFRVSLAYDLIIKHKICFVNRALELPIKTFHSSKGMKRPTFSKNVKYSIHSHLQQVKISDCHFERRNRVHPRNQFSRQGRQEMVLLD